MYLEVRLWAEETNVSIRHVICDCRNEHQITSRSGKFPQDNTNPKDIISTCKVFDLNSIQRQIVDEVRMERSEANGCTSIPNQNCIGD